MSEPFLFQHYFGNCDNYLKQNHVENQKPIIGITLGDYNGIGPEVILKALTNKRILELCTPEIGRAHV